MDISRTAPVGQDYAIRVEKVAQNAAKQQGEDGVALIEGARVPIGVNGEGSMINTHA